MCNFIIFYIYLYFFSVIVVHLDDLSYTRGYDILDNITLDNTITYHIVITGIKLHSGNRLSSREAGYTAANQAIPIIKQAKKKLLNIKE